jgi:hypothetical protein
MRAIEQAVGQTRHSIPPALQLTFGQVSAFVLPPQMDGHFLTERN